MLMGKINLPNNVSRCSGVNYEGDWRDGCEDCLRRTSKSGPRTLWIEPPLVVVFECEYRIEPLDTGG